MIPGMATVGMGFCVAFSPDGRGLVNRVDGGILRFWDVSSLADIKRDRDQDGIPYNKFEGHTVRDF